jgi:hypothetical protein
MTSVFEWGNTVHALDRAALWASGHKKEEEEME